MVSAVVTCEWLKEQLDAGAKGVKVVDGESRDGRVIYRPSHMTHILTHRFMAPIRGQAKCSGRV